MQKSLYIQGIFSTAISKLFLEKGYSLAFPSKTIAKRLNIENTSNNWDVAIISNPIPFGLKIFGKNTSEVVKILREELDPIIIRKSKINLGLTAIGEVIEEGDKKSLVDIGVAKGFILGKFPKGSKIVVATREPAFEEDITFFHGICLGGKYAMLVQNGEIGMPEHMMNSKKGKALLDLAKEILPSGWGLEFFETCINSDEKVIKEELINLIQKGKSFLEKKTNGIAILHEGMEYHEAYLSYESKIKLDEIRNKVLPTLKGHHYLRSWGESMNPLIHFAESLLSRGIEKKCIEESLDESLFSEIFSIGKMMNIFHFKYNGKLIKLSPGRIIESNEKERSITLLRKIKGLGYYDGLEAKKEAGDYAIATYKLGSMVSRTYYYRSNGELIGIYSNFSTPIEIFPNAISYVDLEVDIVRNSKGEIKIIDRSKLEDLVVKEIISEKVYWRILELIENEKKELSST
jgi:protein associated with RNAse G/E